jgi:hypothetical protein
MDGQAADPHDCGCGVHKSDLPRTCTRHAGGTLPGKQGPGVICRAVVVPAPVRTCSIGGGPGHSAYLPDLLWLLHRIVFAGVMAYSLSAAVVKCMGILS